MAVPAMPVRSKGTLKESRQAGLRPAGALHRPDGQRLIDPATVMTVTSISLSNRASQ